MRKIAWGGLACCVLALPANACTFDSSSNGNAEDGDTTGDGTTASSADTLTSSPSGSSATTVDPSETSMSDATSTGEPDDESSTGSSTTEQPTTSSDDSSTTADCERVEPFSQLVWVQDLPGSAIVDMEVVESGMLIYEGMPASYVRSLTADAGSVTFELETECAGELYVWGLVYDQAGGDQPGSADSFWFGIDEDAQPDGDAWVYGCTTEGFGWTWQRLHVYAGCDTDPHAPTLESGAHTFMLLNREDGVANPPNNFNFAGIAALAISNEQSYDPVTDYDPEVGS